MDHWHALGTTKTFADLFLAELTAAKQNRLQAALEEQATQAARVHMTKIAI